MANLSLNPMATTNALGSFGVQSDGYIQGVALDDPANRFNLAAGTVAATETKPLWGGLPVAELLPGTSSSPRGSSIRRAVSVADLCQWRGDSSNRFSSWTDCWTVRENQWRRSCSVQRHCGRAVSRERNNIHLCTGNCTRRRCNHAGHHRRSYAFRHHAAGKSARHRIRQLQDCQL